jgi:hypothetical protein
MTPLFVLAALAQRPELDTTAFGRRSAGDVRSINPDAHRHDGDGAYGRFDGDLDFGLGAGPSLALANGDLGIGVRGVARWYSTAGIYVLYDETLSPHPELERRIGFGLELTPLFLVRWQRALESGPAVLDLALDSLAIGFGGNFSTPAGHGFGSHQTLEGSLGFGVPLAASAPGPWLEFRANLTFPDAARGEAQAVLLFSWHFAVLTPLVAGE